MTEKRLKLQVGDVIYSRYYVYPVNVPLPKEPKVGSVVAWEEGTVWTRRGVDWVPTTDREGAEEDAGPFDLFPTYWSFVVTEGQKLTVLRVGK